MASYKWPPEGSGGGVAIYPTFGSFPAGTAAGQLAVAADTGILYEWNGSAWVAIASPGGALSVGTYDGLTGVANGLQIVNTVLYGQSATATLPGMVNTTTQTFAGNKTFNGSITASNLSGTNTGDVTLGTANGLSLVGQALSLGLSATGATGALSSTDWNTFNGKQAALTIGDLTAAGADGISVTNGTGSVIGGGTAVQQQVATAAQNGYLSSSDFTTFSGKQAAGNYITGLTGDVVATGPGSVNATIQPSVIVNSMVSGVAGIALSKLATLTASRALVSDVGGIITPSSTTLTELTYVNGVTSSIQTQLNTKVTNPMTTGGDLIYGGASGVPTRLANGSAGQHLVSAGGTSAPVWTTPGLPTIQVFLTGTAQTYNRPAGVIYLRVRLVGGGGGGGGGGGSGATIGTAGATTTFGPGSATGGAPGDNSNNAVGPFAGGSGSVTTSGTVIQIAALAGGQGQGPVHQNTLSFQLPGGSGGNSYFGGAGAGGYNTGGGSGAANTGGGGAGGSNNGPASGFFGGGGGAGGYAEFFIYSPSATYSYTVANSANGGSAGTNGYTGGSGAPGQIIVEEYY